MQIVHTKIRVRDIVNGYQNDVETGKVSGYGGKLDIRPAYQREFVYKEKQRNDVIKTIIRGFPLNTIYWAKRKNEDNSWEVLDGQQRIISICEYYRSNFSIVIDNKKDVKYFHNLTQEEQNIILDYELEVYQCDGTDKEKLDWFKIVNIAGEKLTDQELRNVVYFGTWLSDAKKKFSANNCAAYRLANKYMAGVCIRQEYLESCLSWIADKESIKLEEYMAKHQNDDNAGALWSYFSAVIEWVKAVFPHHRKEMKGVPWGLLYNRYGNKYPNTSKTEKEVKRLMMDDDVTCKRGIYEYIFSKDEKCLSIRTFTPAQKREAYEKQNHKCPYCLEEEIDKDWDIEDMEADHITPWSKGGKTIPENCKMLCREHNRRKGST